MVIKWNRALLCLGLLLIGCSSSESEGVPDDYVSRTGKQVFTKTCTVCHGADGKAGIGGAKDLTKSKMDSLSIIDIIKNGKNGMTPQGRYIKTDEELGNVVNYVRTLRK